jgi:hypothetical protein
MFDSSEPVDDLNDIDTHGTHLYAAPTSDAAGTAVLGDKAPLLVVESKLDPIGSGSAEVFPSRHKRVRAEQARVPVADTLAFRRAEPNAIDDVEAIACRAHHTAVSTGNALLP